MKKTLTWAAAVVALLWSANVHAQNLPDDAIARELPLMRAAIVAHGPTNPYLKLSTGLPLNDFDLSRHQPRDYIRIVEELPYKDTTRFVGFEPNSFLKIRSFLPEPPSADDISKHGVDTRANIVGHAPASYLKISSQYPTPKEN